MKPAIKKIIIFLMSLFAVASVSATQVLILHTDFVSNFKIQKLQPLAKQEAIELNHINVDQTNQHIEQAITDADVVILDVPRPSDRQAVEEQASTLLKQLNKPYMTIGGGVPQFQVIPKLFGFRLLDLYANGGELNFRHYFQALHAWKTESKKLKFETQKLPEIAIYHPQAQQYFSQSTAYRTWFNANHTAQPKATIAYLISPSMVTNLTTEKIDQLIALTEAKGIMPMVILWNESRAKTKLSEFFKAQDVTALVNMTHIQQGQNIMQELKQLNIPMLQALHFRGNDAQWQSSASGVPAHTAAIFLSLPETWGFSDPLVLSVQEGDQEQWLKPQIDLLLDKVIAQAKLKHLPNAEKKIALMFWNYPQGQNNLSAANLNIPLSLHNIQQAMLQQGYQSVPLNEKEWISTAQQLLAAYYQPEKLADLAAKNWLAYYPVDEYLRWLKLLPEQRQAELQASANPEKLAQHWAVIKRNGALYFAIPRAELGKLTLLPQPPRGSKLGENYHSSEAIPDPLYLATYLYLQKETDALVHLGTHGTQEWLPGKDRGLAASDYPFLTAGRLPIFYPYIQDNIAEAIQAKRRGRAVVISHQTAPLAPSGLYDELRDLHDLIHQYVQLDEGAVQQQTQDDMIAAVQKSGIDKDLELTAEQMKVDFPAFQIRLHDHLHVLAQQAVPMGLHKFGQSATDAQRLIIVMQQLSQPYFQALNSDMTEAFNGDTNFIQQSPAYRFLAHHLLQQEDQDVAKIRLNAELKAFLKTAQQNFTNLDANVELSSLLNALSGGFVQPGSGGDPIRKPDSISGRNLFAFEANKVPSPSAYEIGGKTFQQMLAQYQQKHPQQYPKKIAFSLWSSETIRHLGVTEGQLLHALGLQPIWDEAGRITRLDIIPRFELKHPRVDVVVQVTSVYRDQFDHFMRLVSEAIERLSVLDEADNPLFTQAQAMEKALLEKKVPPEDAHALAQLKFFSNQPGEYGSGLIDKALAYDDWDNDQAVAQTFLNNLQYAYGSKHWGEQLDVNLFAENLKGVDLAVMSRSSNVHGVLSTDHAFEYLGGLSLAIRTIQGHAPELLITDLRQNKTEIATLKSYLADELRTRYLNPEWIKNMQAEGYAGTLEVLTVTNNVYGWNVTDPSVVRDDQWQDLYETYVEDKRSLGVNEWFKTHNLSAQLQVLNRMAEAIRQEYWQADEQTRHKIVQKIQDLQQQVNLPPESQRLNDFVESILAEQDQQSAVPMATPVATVSNPSSTTEQKPPSQAKAERPVFLDHTEQTTARGQGLNMNTVVQPSKTQPVAQEATQPAAPVKVKGQALEQVRSQAQPEHWVWLGAFFISVLIALGIAYQVIQQRKH